jgi:hypothetical protein
VPAIAALAWEVRLQRRSCRVALGNPVSPEAIRWGQYAAAVYQLGHAALALAAFDDRGQLSVWPLLTVIACSCASGGLLWWSLGQKYGSETPRLHDLRQQLYSARLKVWQRQREVAWHAWHSRGSNRLYWQADATSATRLLRRLSDQMALLQGELSTDGFVTRLRDPRGFRAQLDEIALVHRQLLAEVDAFLVDTSAAEMWLTVVAERVTA